MQQTSITRKRFGIRRAFTIVEVMVTISIILVLTAIAVPALSRARSAAQRTASMANLAQIATTMGIYHGENADRYPDLSVGIPYSIGDGTVSVTTRWGASIDWPLAFQELLPWKQFRSVYLSPGRRPIATDFSQSSSGANGSPYRSSYVLSQTTLAAPEVWIPGSSMHPAFFRSVRSTDVWFPGAKAILWDYEMAFYPSIAKRTGRDIQESTPMAFADGHVALKQPSMASAPVQPIVDEDGMSIDSRLHNTSAGSRGRDY